MRITPAIDITLTSPQHQALQKLLTENNGDKRTTARQFYELFMEGEKWSGELEVLNEIDIPTFNHALYEGYDVEKTADERIMMMMTQLNSTLAHGHITEPERNAFFFGMMAMGDILGHQNIDLNTVRKFRTELFTPKA